MAKLVLMSIRPVYAKAIYSKQKKFEYRRIFTKITTGDRILVYESSSSGLITGEFTAGEIIKGIPQSLMTLEKDFNIQELVKGYLKNAKASSAIEIINPFCWEHPIKLKDYNPTITPPQSYIFLN